MSLLLKQEMDSRSGTLVGVFVAGIGTFVNLYATQPLLPYFRQLFRASELLVSLTVSATVIAVALTAPLIGSFADKIGRKRVIVAAMIGLSLVTLLSARSTNLGELVIWRFLQGCFIPGIIAVTMAYISEESEPRSTASTMAIYVTGTIIGGFGGRFASGLAVTRWDWHGAFILLGLVTLGGAMATWWFLPRSAKFVRQRNITSAFQFMGIHLRNRELIATYAVGFNVLFCLVSAFTYVNFYLADKPFFLGPAILGSIFAVHLIAAAITPLSGRIINHVGHRRALMGAVALSGGGMLLTLIPFVPIIITGLAMEVCGVFICQSASSSHVGKAAREAKSSAAGLYVSFYYFGGFMGSILPGIIWRQAGWFGCVVIILCIQCLTILIAHKFWQN